MTKPDTLHRTTQPIHDSQPQSIPKSSQARRDVASRDVASDKAVRHSGNNSGKERKCNSHVSETEGLCEGASRSLDDAPHVNGVLVNGSPRMTGTVTEFDMLSPSELYGHETELGSSADHDAILPTTTESNVPQADLERASLNTSSTAASVDPPRISQEPLSDTLPTQNVLRHSLFPDVPKDFFDIFVREIRSQIQNDTTSHSPPISHSSSTHDVLDSEVATHPISNPHEPHTLSMSDANESVYAGHPANDN